MNSRVTILVMCCCGIGLAFGQTPAPDRKDYAIEAIERQRNEANNREVVCRAETGPALDALRAEVEKLRAELAEARKPAKE